VDRDVLAGQPAVREEIVHQPRHAVGGAVDLPGVFQTDRIEHPPE
jgi:hypothetical protein